MSKQAQLIAVFVLFFSTLSFARLSPEVFQKAFDAAQSDEFEVSDTVIEKAGSYRYVFVGGFLNEGLCKYFRDNREALIEFGVPKRLVEEPIYPPSNKTIAENAPALMRKLKTLADKGSEKLIIMGHSKGGIESFVAAIQDPDFVNQHVEAIITIQGAFGSGIADYMAGHGMPVSEEIPEVFQKILKATSKLENFLEPFVKGGLISLETKVAQALLDELRKKFPSSFSLVSDKIYYVRSWEEPRQNPLKGQTYFLKPLGWYLKTSYCKESVTDDAGVIHTGLNDGLVCLEDQSVKGVGTLLATLEDADHFDLMTTRSTSNQTKAFRFAFTKALARTIGD